MKPIRDLKTLILICALLEAGAVLASGSPFEVQIAQDQLKRQNVLLQQIEKDVERQDLPRIHRLKAVTEKVLSSIGANGIGNTETLRDYEELVLSYRYSADLLTQVSTARTQPKIAEVKAISDKIAKDRGMDTPYTEITEQTFRQIYDLLQSINQLDISKPLKDSLNAARAPIGNLLAIASQGDRPETFAAALPVYQQIRALYPQLNQISSASAAFEVIINLQGLTEFYGAFAQIGAQSGSQKGGSQ